MPKVETFDKAWVIKQATLIFHDKGYNGTSMQDLVDATGLNRSSIYNSFDNKLNLFLLCLKAYREEFGTELNNEFKKANNPLHALELLFDFLIDLIFEDKDDKGCLVTNCTSEMANQESRITEFLKSNKDSFSLFLEDLVFKGQQECVFNKKQSPKDYALYLFSSIQGFRIAGILTRNKTDLQTIAKTIVQTLI